MRPGNIVATRFKIELTAGSGGMGTVYRAIDLHNGEPVALKVLRDPNEDHVRRFAKEAEVLYRLNHPRVVRYISHGRTERGQLFLVMEWLEGESLSQVLRHRRLKLHEAYAVALGTAEAVAVAHDNGVLHRDIKPANLLLCDGRVDRLKLLDFGLARMGRGMGHTNTGELLGTPGYMAPEQARGDRNIDERADVFALACVMYRCFTGRRAFDGDDALAVLAKLVLEDPQRMSVLRSGIPSELDALVARMLSKDRSQRPLNGQAVVEALQPFADELTISDEVSLPGLPIPEALPTITVKEQRVMCLVVARYDAAGEEGGAAAEGATAAEKMASIQLAVDPFGGKADQLIDGTMLISVSAGPPAEQAARAGRCALALRAELGPVPIVLAAGRGLLAAGALLGEAIDRAAALLALNDTRSIRINEAAAALMRDRFDIQPDDRGAVLRGSRANDDHTRRLLGRPTTCVGRARELRNLQALFEECVSEPVARAVLVTAPAGLGKSRVRFELMRRLIEKGTIVDEEGDERHFQIWLARGDPMSAGSAFGMIGNAIRQATGVRVGEPIENRRRKLEDRVARVLPESERRRVADFLGELIGAPFDDDNSVQLRAARSDPTVMGDQMRRAFEDFIVAECEHTPLLMVLEDLHWGDLPSVNFIDSVLRNHSELPLMVLAFARPDVHEMFPNLWGERDVQEIRLSRLTKKAGAKLVRQVLGDAISEEVVDRIVNRAEGNAFYLEELIRAVAGGKGNRLPESVLAMVQSRLEELDGEARRLLRGASIFGQVFWGQGVENLIGETRAGDLRDWLLSLEERELITRRPDSKFPGSEEYVFRHSLMRDAAYAALTENDRELGHRLAGRWLENAGEKEAVVLAEHFERGGDKPSTVRWYCRAAEQALEGNDLVAAVARAEKGVDSGATDADLGRLRLLQADSHRWRGEFAEMEQRALVAMNHLERGGAAWCKSVAEIAVACRALGHYDQLTHLAEELASLEVPGEKAAYVEAAARTAMQLFLIGWAKHGDALLARVAPFETTLAHSHPSAVAWIHHARAFGALHAADPGAYLQLCETAAAEFDQAGDLRSVTNARVHLGFAYIEVGGYAQAESALREALASAQRMGLHNVVATAMNNLGIALARLGQLKEAAVIESEAIRLAGMQGDQRIEGASRQYLALIRLLAGQYAASEAEALKATEQLQVAPPLRAHALATLAQAQLAQGKIDAAWRSTREAIALFDSLGGIEEGESTLRLVHAETLYAAGEKEAALAVIEQAYVRIHERAVRIKDPGWRASFLTQVPENARTVSLAEQWLPAKRAAALQRGAQVMRTMSDLPATPAPDAAPLSSQARGEGGA